MKVFRCLYVGSLIMFKQGPKENKSDLVLDI